jgi:hypothetical protein
MPKNAGPTPSRVHAVLGYVLRARLFGCSKPARKKIDKIIVQTLTFTTDKNQVNQNAGFSNESQRIKARDNLNANLQKAEQKRKTRLLRVYAYSLIYSDA